MTNPASSSGASHVTSPHDVLSGEQQDQLRAIITRELERFLAMRGKSNTAGFYFLVSFTWGWGRRVAWTTEQMKSYADRAWDKCRDVTNELRAVPRRLWTPGSK